MITGYGTAANSRSAFDAKAFPTLRKGRLPGLSPCAPSQVVKPNDFMHRNFADIQLRDSP